MHHTAGKGYQLEWVVSAEEAGSKLIVFLSHHLSDRYSARFLKRMIEHNRCQINQRTERFASTILNKGERIRLDLEGDISPPRAPALQFEPERLLYEDADLLIYNKPAGVNSDEKGILQLLKTHFLQLQLIHRLDRDTTGILLLAKNPLILNKMEKLFKEIKIYKCYAAIVDGVLFQPKGFIENYLGKKHVYAGQTIWGVVNKKQGLYAYTDWIKIKEGQGACLLHCFPKTGRTHQIRVHLASIGHPILGDFQYCKQFHCSYRPNRHLLHAYKVAFKHPETGQMIQVQAPLPKDFLMAQQELFKK